MMASTRLRPQPQQSAPSARARAAKPAAKSAGRPAASSRAKLPAKPAVKPAAKPRAKPRAKPIVKQQREPALQAVTPPPQSGWGVYILRCADGTLYTGCTNDQVRRLRSHGRGQVKYTRGRLPVALVYWEGSVDKSAALRREAALKRLSRRTKLALCR